MKKLFLLSTIFVICLAGVKAQVETIASAKTKSDGTEVTITGIVTNGAELGDEIRYFQDATGGIAAYGSVATPLKSGDSILITGKLKTFFGLQEIDPITELNVISGGHTLPAPTVLTPSQYGEAYEGMIIRTMDAKFNGEGTFSSGQNYDFNASNQTGEIRISSGNSPLIGEVIPQDTVIVSGILSEYNGKYQVLVRLSDDLKSTKSVSFTSPPVMSNLSTSGFTISWTTDSSSTTEAYIGNTPELELPPIKEAGEDVNHSFTVSGSSASTIFYVRPFSVRNNDTTFAGTKVYVTQSESSGDMKAYFTSSVDNSLSTGVDAIHVNYAIADTLVNYINRATTSIDLAIYNMNNYSDSKIVNALNSAFGRGVDVRVVYDSNTANAGIDNLHAGIGKIIGPGENFPYYGIMHNKFLVFDVNSVNNSFVWTGSTNFTSSQLTRDANNVIIVQDKSLALAYTLEFNEMFGSTTTTPNRDSAKFGPDKTDNTPHDFIIGGKKVELYFSPSDGTHGHILNTINSATENINVAAMTLTKGDAAWAIIGKNEAGVTSRVIIDEPTPYDKVDELGQGLKENFRINGESGIMHHKYAIIDHTSASTAKVLTGSHNWTGSAQERNDENTLIIHDQTLANVYLQEFSERFSSGLIYVPVCNPDSAEVIEGQSSVTIDILSNDSWSGNIEVVKLTDPQNGLSNLIGDNQLYYQPYNNFLDGVDTIWYQIKSLENTQLTCSTWVKIVVDKGGNNNLSSTSINPLNIFPNPTSGMITINMAQSNISGGELSIFNTLGKQVFTQKITRVNASNPIDLQRFEDGVYHIRFSAENGETFQTRIILKK